ncbi:FtsK/SpoIIIE domain-containing protein [Corynebacterium mastitidis]
MWLDLKESAHGGMGPHGLCIGATGSGKSELLRTLVVGLTATHSPEELTLILVDFKGGATFLGLDRLPHTSAVITNLEQESVLVERMHDAIAGEMNRRQEVLRAAGNFANVHDYEAARRAGRDDLDPMPALLIVVDEFSELLGQHPDFADLFVAVGRLGRSLHVHLLLASQRLEEGRLRGLDSHLSYRIGLRTFSAAESRQVLGVPDAHDLPAVPGMGFIKVGPQDVVGF